MRTPGRNLLWTALLLALWFGVRAWYFTPGTGVGETAPDFTAVNPAGERFRLSDFRGRHVLLDFWGSWCGPCRRKSPALVDLHERLGDRLTIVSIGIERDSSAWRLARTRDARSWTSQAMDGNSSLRFLDGPLSQLYGVNRVPTNFLIDPAGRVLGVDVPPAEVPAFLAAD